MVTQADFNRLWAELSQLRVELRRISTQQIRSELTGAQTDINDLESDVAALPLGVLGYAEVTSNQTGISSETDLTGLSVTVDLPANRLIRVSAHAQVRQNTSAGVVTGAIKDGGSSLGRFARDVLDSGEVRIVTGSVVVSPSSGSHTYKLTLATSSDTVDLQAASIVPAFILVTGLGLA